MSSKTRHVKDKWRGKGWYMVVAPSFFGNVELGSIPAEDPKQLIGRVVEATLYDITADFSHHYLKMFFQVNEIEAKTAKTLFKGHEYSRDYLRSLVRRRTTKVDSLINLTTKDGFKLRIAKTIHEKAEALSLDQFVQEMVLGKIASDIYNQAKEVAPLRHVGIRKSKLLAAPQIEGKAKEAPAEPAEPEEVAEA
ncbi:MAG: 30S ribosomal protein S3ae [Candidatus Bathyarchaeia archaeon]